MKQTKRWFGMAFTTFCQETEQPYSYNPKACTDLLKSWLMTNKNRGKACFRAWEVEGSIWVGHCTPYTELCLGALQSNLEICILVHLGIASDS